MMRPVELYRWFRQILADTCGCDAAWDQHPQPMTPQELAIIRSRLFRLLDGVTSDSRLYGENVRVKVHAATNREL